ncbi:MAG: DNA mismatch repair protein MutS [Candidatus Caenarcaniphilales bacterium]|nr:DNA mismatch repair protein MutS [Candidatus Caenarcaniphilales bacterium]
MTPLDQPNSEKYTPVLRQYLEERQRVGDALLLFRLGDFYECFFQDAETLANELELTLTARADQAHPGGKVPMAGIPFRAAEGYITKLLNLGHKVAICEQVGDPNGKGPMRRELVRVLTPGTMLEGDLLSEKPAFLAAIAPPHKNKWGLAFCNIATGEFLVTELSSQELELELSRLAPSELLIATDTTRDDYGFLQNTRRLPEGLNLNSSTCETERPIHHFDLDQAKRQIKNRFGEFALEGFGLTDLGSGLGAIGAVLDYLSFTYPESLATLFRIQPYKIDLYLQLDGASLRNLEIFETSLGKSFSLLELIEKKLNTKAGARLMRDWLSKPLLDLSMIRDRQASIALLMQSPGILSTLSQKLKRLSDLERIAAKLAAKRLNPAELGGLRDTILKLPELIEDLSPLAQVGKLLKISYSVTLWEKTLQLKSALTDEPPLLSNEGGIIREAFSPKLDQLRHIVSNNQNWLGNYENEQRENTGIKSLKVCFNKAAGFYIEIPKTNRTQPPADYHIKQNLTNINRYWTPLLKAHENDFIVAEASLFRMEHELFEFLREDLNPLAPEIKSLGQQLAQLDCLVGLASLALENHYTRPEILKEPVLEIEAGRHPVLEKQLAQGYFTPNDLRLAGRDSLQPPDNQKTQIIILTGPNMSGKSTYMKQNALICIMAQIGSFVPAESAQIGLVDRIFTRIGAGDDLATGQSTFMVEMTETASLLNNFTPSSLILLDEVGRGTSTYDGVAIAWSVIEYLANHGPRVLFATHYHELNDLSELFPQIANFQVAVTEENKKIFFTHRVIPGGADRSYGIEVARMAGLPSSVISRAQTIMSQMHARSLPARKRQLVKESITKAQQEGHDPKTHHQAKLFYDRPFR